MKRFQKIVVSVFACALLIAPALIPARAAGFLNTNAANEIHANTNAIGQSAGYDPNATVPVIVATVIKAFLGLLGIIFVILIIVAGFNWMTAGGDEEKIQKATALIRNAVIGLVIIVSAYAITYFVFQNLPGGSGSSQGNNL